MIKNCFVVALGLRCMLAAAGISRLAVVIGKRIPVDITVMLFRQ